MNRTLHFSEAIREALDLCLTNDENVYLMGLGTPDAKGVFSSTLDLHKKHGSHRVMDIPTSENGFTGVALGSALVGRRPIITHQRADFNLLAMEQIVNQAANWHYMFGGKQKVPMVIRMIIGRGWGQGPQHSQSLQALFAHVPGLKVVMPTFPDDAKGLLISSVEDDNPVMFLEHRWLYNIVGWVPEGMYRTPLGKAKVVREGGDLTIVSTSYMTLEAIRAADILADEGVLAEVIDVRTLKPLDKNSILDSIRKTGRLIAADTGWKTLGFSAEIIACACENALENLRCPPVRIALPDCPTPTSRALANRYYPMYRDIVEAAMKMFCMRYEEPAPMEITEIPMDVPDKSFVGPF